jgi:Arc/MetJ-type ribon-helix-helix transcriptional regulator
MINIALKDDLERLLRMKVENGEFPNEEAVVTEALKCFLIQEASRGGPMISTPPEELEGRQPGPFIEDDTALAPVELPRPGRKIGCNYLHDATRLPNFFPGE